MRAEECSMSARTPSQGTWLVQRLVVREVVAILAEDAAEVEFGQGLFQVRPTE